MTDIMMKARTPNVRKHVHSWRAHTQPIRFDRAAGRLREALTGDDEDPTRGGRRLLHRACADCGTVQHARVAQRDLEDLPAICKYFADVVWADGELDPFEDPMHELFT